MSPPLIQKVHTERTIYDRSGDYKAALSEEKWSYLYLVETLDRRYVKVGIARDLFNRVHTIQVGNPMPVRLAVCKRFDSREQSMEAESAVRKAISGSLGGEWHVQSDRYQRVRTYLLCASGFHEEDLEDAARDLPESSYRSMYGDRWRTGKHCREVMYV